jgi:hypothetical protein
MQTATDSFPSSLTAGTAMREKRKSTTSLPASTNTTRGCQPGAMSSFMVSGAVTVIGGCHRLRSSTANELCVARSTSSCYTAHIHIHMARRVDLASEFSVIDMWAPRPTRPCRLISSSLFLQSRRVVQHIYQIHVHQTFC